MIYVVDNMIWIKKNFFLEDVVCGKEKYFYELFFYFNWDVYNGVRNKFFL